jgi:short-subunit dehydrogenase
VSAPLRVFLTGASSGIGHALATHYADGGATLGLVARRSDALQAMRNALHTECAVYPVDVRDARGMRQAAEEFAARVGGVDVVIGNAGVSAGTLTERAEDQAVFREIMEINVTGLFNTFSPFLPAMRGAGRGTLAGIASVAGFRGLPGAGAYSASKAAARTYLESLRVELHGTGVRVVTISPGYIRTPMTDRNPYPMPFLLPADEAARRMARAIARGAAHTVIPWQMGLVGLGLRALPRPLYDRLFARAPRKPRRGE